MEVLWGIGDNVPLGSPIYEMGNGNSAFAPHLHLSYVPETYYSTANGEVLDDYRYTSANPMSVFNYNSYTNYDVTNLKLESDGSDAWLRFDVEVDPEAIDINEVVVGFNAATVDGDIAYEDFSSYGPLLDGTEGYQTLGGETFFQELGRVDFEERVGYNFGPRSSNSNNSTFNGLKIIPGSYSSSNQSDDHSYTFKFKLDNDVIEHVIGGMQNIIVYVENSDNAINYNTYSSLAETVNDVVWTQKWSYDTDFTWADSFEDIRVLDDGKILILNQNSSKTTQTTLPSQFTLRIQDGGKFETEDGAGISSRTYFTTQGSFYVEDGGQIVLGDNSWFTVDGSNGFFQASFNSLNPIVGNASEFFGTNGGRYKFKKFLSLSSPETCIAVKGGSKVTFENGASFSNGSFLAASGPNGIFEIIGNLTLSGPGNNDGYGLDLPAGSLVKVGYNSKIIVKDGAKMRSLGTASNPVKFTYYQPKWDEANAWPGIEMRGDGNVFKHTIVEGAIGQGLYFRSDDNLVEYSNIRDNIGYGIRTSYDYSGGWGSVKIKDSKIENNGKHGVYVRNSYVGIEYSDIKNNSGDGIYVYYGVLGFPFLGAGFFRGNDISGNASNAVQISYRGRVYDGFSSIKGNNNFGDNISHEIYLSSYNATWWDSRSGGYSAVLDNNSSTKNVYNLAQTSSGENAVSWTVGVENYAWNYATPPRCKF